MDKIITTIDFVLERFENRYGRLVVSVFIGILFLIAAAMVTSIRFETFHHGNGFTRLSLHPFDFSLPNDLRYRILSPLLGYLLFFRGPAFKFFMLIVLAVFLAFIYFFRREENMKPSAALLITALCAFSTLTFHQLYFPAYNDPLSYLLILLFLAFFKEQKPATLLLTLMLFNHENTIFLFPFFFFLSLSGNFSFRNMLIVSLRFLMAVVLYWAYREFISYHVKIEYTASYYLDPNQMKWTQEHVLPHLLIGVFQAFRLFWIFPIVAIAINIYEKRSMEIALFFLAMCGVLAQFLVAFDISRLAGLAFPVVILSAIRTANYLGYKKFLIASLIIVITNFLIPSVYIGALDPIPLRPFWLN